MNGRRVRWSCRTDDWELAAKRAREYESLSKHTAPLPAALRSGAPELRQFAERYLEEDTGHLAATTVGDRRSCLRPEGPLMAHFGDSPLDTIRAQDLRVYVPLSRYQ